MLFLQRRSLAPSQLAKRKAGGEEEDGEWRPPAVSEGLRGVGPRCAGGMLGGSGTGSSIAAGCCWFCPWALEGCGGWGCPGMLSSL